jgi:hypothetical protein
VFRSFCVFAVASTSAIAGEADVVDVELSCSAARVCNFSVTVRHDDAGWQHYANRWDILTADGELIATRELLHPHDQEQPFTRSLNGVAIPAGVNEVVVRAHDSVHGYGGREVTVTVD